MSKTRTCSLTRSRPQLDKCLADLKPGGVLTVWKLDRLRRSLSHLVAALEDLNGRGVAFLSLRSHRHQQRGGPSAGSHDSGAAEFEQALITERTRAGIKAAKRRGVKLGRKPALSSEQVAHACKLIDKGDSPGEVAKLFKVARSTRRWGDLLSPRKTKQYRERKCSNGYQKNLQSNKSLKVLLRILLSK